MRDERDQHSFWTTLPGILTGVAAVITAVDGLIGGLYAAGIIGNEPNSPTPEPPVTITTPPDTITATPPDNNPGEGCVMTVVNPLVSLKRDPDTFSLDVVRLEPGDYPVLEHREVLTPLGAESWFRFESEGRMGG
jgi:hypothetical protein